MQNHVYTRVGLYTALAILTAACSTVYFTEDDFRRAAQVHDAELVRLGPAFAGTARALEDLCGDAAQDVRYPERRAGGKIGFRSESSPLADGQGAFANGAVGRDPFERVLVRLEQSESFRRLGDLGRLFVKRLASIFATAWVLVWFWGAVLVDGWYCGRVRRAENSPPGRIRLTIVKAGAELLVLALFAMMVPAAWSAWASVAVVALAALLVRTWLIHTSRFD